MNFNREMANILAGSGTKIIYGNVNPYIEWIKWLSYVPEFLKAKIQ